jgi:hypothetical protein
MSKLYTELRHKISDLNLHRLKWAQTQLRARLERWRGTFEDVNTFCLFIGYPRSGHSLVGSLLDAHPNAIIAHEADALGLLQGGATRDELFTFLLSNSQYYARFGRNWTGYSYIVPGQWQGRYERLTVVGDKKGGRSSLWLASNPELLDALRTALGASLRIRVIHVVRNPFDNISTISRKDDCAVPEAIDRYQRLLTGTNRALDYFGADETTTLKFEDVVLDPRGHLLSLVGFLGLTAGEEYLSACSSILFEKPKQTRQAVEWRAEDIQRVVGLIDQTRFLGGYSYEE